MAVDYTLLFTRLGRYVAESNLWLTRQGTLLLNADVGADDILDEFNANRDLADGVLDLYLAAADDQRRLVAGLSSKAQTLLGALQTELLSSSSSMNTLMPLLIERMRDDGKTVKANVVSSPVVALVSGSVGNGGLSVSKMNGDGVDDESVVSETVKVRCIRDRFSGSAAGSEAFEIVGAPKRPKEDGFNPRGSGPGPALLGGDAANLLGNGSFASFASNVPTGWTLSAGVAGTDVLDNTTVLNAYAHTLELKSGGSSTITLYEAMSGIAAKKVHVANVWVRRSGGSWTSGGLLKFTVKGTGISDQNVVSVDPALLTASFANFSLFLATPASVPSDYRVEITWTGANLNSGKSVYLSGSAFRLPVMHGGSAYALFRGSTDFLVGDDFNVTTANDYGGKFQTWCTRFLGFQLPSSGSPNISDTLAA